MSGKIVQNDVDLLAWFAMQHDLLQEQHKLIAGMARGRLAEHFAGLHIESSVERQGAVPIVLESMALGAPRRHGQDRIQTVQRLQRSLLIHAKDRGVLRWIEIEANDVGRLALEIRIVARHVTLQSVRLQIRPLPDSLHAVFTDTQTLRQFAARPMGRSVLRLTSGRTYYLRRQCRSNHKRLFPGMANLRQSRDAPLQESILPSEDGRRSCIQPLLNRSIRQSLSQHQNQTRPENISRRQTPRPRHLFQFVMLFSSYRDRLGRKRHTSLDVPTCYLFQCDRPLVSECSTSYGSRNFYQLWNKMAARRRNSTSIGRTTGSQPTPG